MAERSELPLPTFLIIGAQKSATVWLGHNLSQHPEVYVSPTEAMFFNYSKRFHGLGVEWYRQQFEGWDGEPVVGESTPGYLMLSHRPERSAKRIRATLPDVRLLALLRNPVDRAQSAMVHNIRRRRLPLDSRLVDLVRDEPDLVERHNLITGGLYAQSLEPYLRLFGDRLLIALLEDVMDAPGDTYRRVLRHIGVTDDRFVPSDLAAVRHTNLPTGDADGPGQVVIDGLGKAKRAVLRQSRRAGDFAVEPISAADRRELSRVFEDDITALEGLLGRDLSRWRPPPS